MGVWEFGESVLSLFFSVGMAALRPWLGTFLRFFFSLILIINVELVHRSILFFALSGAVARVITRLSALFHTQAGLRGSASRASS